MPLDETTRFLLEQAIRNFLYPKREATTKQLLYHITKPRRYAVVYKTKQLAQVCRTLENRRVLLSRLGKAPRKTRDEPIRMVRFWRLNPDYSQTGVSMYSKHGKSMNLKEIDKARKRRQKAKKTVISARAEKR
jgi:hypothetical protein